MFTCIFYKILLSYANERSQSYCKNHECLWKEPFVNDYCVNDDKAGSID